MTLVTAHHDQDSSSRTLLLGRCKCGRRAHICAPQVSHDCPQSSQSSPDGCSSPSLQSNFPFFVPTMDAAVVDMTKPERKASAPVKRRVSRACDHCHRMRTRCNGQAPCSRCIGTSRANLAWLSNVAFFWLTFPPELEYVCQYNREKKRRGKVSSPLLRFWPYLARLGASAYPEAKRRGRSGRPWRPSK